MQTSQTTKNINLALFNFRKEVPSIHKASQGHKYKYADLPTMVNTIQPYLEAVGILWLQDNHYDTERNIIGVSTKLIHVESDEYIHFSPVFSPIEKTNGMNVIQGIGKDNTYLRRYSLQCALGLVCEEDTDGVKEEPQKHTLKVKRTFAEYTGLENKQDEKKREKGRKYLMMLCKQNGVSDDERYEITRIETGKTSTKDLNVEELRRVCTAVKNRGVVHA